MRSTDIHIEWNDSRDRTENMYLPSQVPVEEMSLSEARRGLCARAMGSTAACRSGCWAAGDGTGGRGSNRGSVAAGTAERAAGAEGAAEAGGTTNQAAGRACKDGQAGTATGREVALSGGAADPSARAGGHGPEPDGRRDGDGQGHPGGGVCIQERLSPGGEKNGRGAGTAWA